MYTTSNARRTTNILKSIKLDVFSTKKTNNNNNNDVCVVSE